MSLTQRIRDAEAELFDHVGVSVDESFVALRRTKLNLRVLAYGSGPPLILLHGVALSAAVWAPLLTRLPGRRLLSVDLPGHGLSDPAVYRRGSVRAHAWHVIEDLFDALELEHAPIVANSLGAMFALWYAATGTERISSLVAIGDPAVALPGACVRMPLSLLTVRGLGFAVLRSPSPPPLHRHLLAQGLGRAEVASAPAPLLTALRLSARRRQNAKTVASLMHAIDRFRRPRPESVLTRPELATISTPTTFIWGSDDPYLSPQGARPSIDAMPAATLHEMAAGHGPWLVDAERAADIIQTHVPLSTRQ